MRRRRTVPGATDEMDIDHENCSPAEFSDVLGAHADEIEAAFRGNAGQDTYEFTHDEFTYHIDRFDFQQWATERRIEWAAQRGFDDDLEPGQLLTDDDINPDGLPLLCYYVTAAALTHRSVPELMQATEQLPESGGASLERVVQIFSAAGLLATYTLHHNLEQVLAEIRRNHPCKWFACAFSASLGGHVVVLHVTPGRIEVRDYSDARGNTNGNANWVDGTPFLAQGESFYLFPQGHIG